MKKKNLMTGIVSLSLAAVMGVGATMAYLTATDDAVTNTFTFGGMTVGVTEEQPVPGTDDEWSIDGGDAESGWNYVNVIPGTVLPKEPTISTTTSADAYVFVRVTDPADDINVTEFNLTDWTVLSTDAATGVTVLYQTVSGAASAQDLGAVFSTVTVSDSATGTATPSIKIEVAEIQQEGFDTAAAAYAQASFQTASVG